MAIEDSNQTTQSGSGIRIKHRFEVYRSDAPDVKLGSFKTISGLRLETEVIDWKTGDMNTMTKLPGFTNFTPIVFTKGFDANDNLKEWYDLVWNLTEGGGSASYRYDLIVKVLNRDNTQYKQIRIFQAWPNIYEPDDLDGQSSDPWQESIEVQHNGWTYEDFGGTPQIDDPDSGSL